MLGCYSESKRRGSKLADVSKHDHRVGRERPRDSNVASITARLSTTVHTCTPPVDAGCRAGLSLENGAKAFFVRVAG